jgi:hypothetical protein
MKFVVCLPAFVLMTITEKILPGASPHTRHGCSSLSHDTPPLSLHTSEFSLIMFTVATLSYRQPVSHFHSDIYTHKVRIGIKKDVYVLSLF